MHVSLFGCHETLLLLEANLFLLFPYFCPPRLLLGSSEEVVGLLALQFNCSHTKVFKLSLPCCHWWIITADGVWLLSMAHLMARWGSNKGQRNAGAPRQSRSVHNKQHKIRTLFCITTEAMTPRAARPREGWPLTPTIPTIVPGRGTLLYCGDTWPVRPRAE